MAVSSTNGLVQWILISNATLTGATWAVTTQSTNVQIDTAATAVSGGRQFETGFGQTGSPSTLLDTAVFDHQIGRNSFTQVSDTITLAVVQQAGGGFTTVYWSLAWGELI